MVKMTKVIRTIVACFHILSDVLGSWGCKFEIRLCYTSYLPFVQPFGTSAVPPGYWDSERLTRG